MNLRPANVQIKTSKKNEKQNELIDAFEVQ